jgi:hypothetical protein
MMQPGRLGGSDPRTNVRQNAGAGAEAEAG